MNRKYFKTLFKRVVKLTLLNLFVNGDFDSHDSNTGLSRSHSKKYRIGANCKLKIRYLNNTFTFEYGIFPLKTFYIFFKLFIFEWILDYITYIKILINDNRKFRKRSMLLNRIKFGAIR